MHLDPTQLTRACDYTDEDAEQTVLGRQFDGRVRSYLSVFKWCKSVIEVYSGIVIPPVLGVMLAHIEPREDADEWLWVVVGDLPPAYIDLDPDYTPNATCALDSYVGAMTEWVEAAEANRPVDGMIPVDVSPTPEHAAMLRTRLAFINEVILPSYSDQLLPHPGRGL